MVDSINEECLLAELKDGSFQAFGRLYNMHNGKLYNFIMRISPGNQYTVEEIVQSAFIRVQEVRERVEPESSSTSFLCAIAKNLLMNMYQRRTIEHVYNECSKNTGVDRDSQTEESIDSRFLNEHIDSLAEELSARRKKIFILSKR